MSETTTINKNEMFIRVSNIMWCEGPEEGYQGPKEFWFIIDKQMNKYLKDPIHDLALFQEIDNLLDDASEYGGVSSDELECKVYTYEQLKEEFQGQEMEMIDLTKEKV